MQNVFMENYTRALIKALHPFGDVLEVGITFASKVIETYHPQTHTIIEPQTENVLKWASKHPNVKIIEDSWQNALPQLGVFDTLFFGLDPHESASFQSMMRIRYADSDLALLCRGIESVVDKKPLSRFLAELEQNGQITPEQRDGAIRTYRLTKEKPPVMKRSDQMFLFLQQCISSHMRRGSRFSCFLESEFDDPRFFNEIVVDPHLDYRGDGRIIVIEKLV